MNPPFLGVPFRDPKDFSPVKQALHDVRSIGASVAQRLVVDGMTHFLMNLMYQIRPAGMGCGCRTAM